MPETRSAITSDSLVSLSASYPKLISRQQTLVELTQNQTVAIQRQTEETARNSAALKRMMEMLEQLQLSRADNQTTEAQPPLLPTPTPPSVKSVNGTTTTPDNAIDNFGSAVATGVFDLHLEVSPIDSTQSEVISVHSSSMIALAKKEIQNDMYGLEFGNKVFPERWCSPQPLKRATIDFNSVLVLRMDDIGHESDEFESGKIISRNLHFCTEPVRQNVCEIFPFLLPPGKPPDECLSLPKSYLAKPQKLLYPSQLRLLNYPLLIKVSQHIYIGYVGVPDPNRFAYSVDNRLICQEPVHPNWNHSNMSGGYSYTHPNNGFQHHRRKAAPIHHLVGTNAEWETASQIIYFTKYLNDYKLDKMWQGLFLTSLRVHMIYSSPEEDLVWSTLLKIKILDNNWVAGKTASHKLSLKVNMSSMLSKDDWVRIEMKKVKFDDSYRSAACVDGWEDDYIRALGGRHIDDKYGTSQENDISALKNYMGAGFLGKDDIGTPSKLLDGVMSRKVRHTASRLIHLYVGQDWRSAYMGQEDLLFSQSRSIIRGPFEELCSKEPSSNFGDIWEPSCEEDSIKITLKSCRKSIFRQMVQTVLQEVVSIETQVRAAGLWTFYFNICHDEWVICLRYVKLVVSELITEFLLNFLGFLSSQFGCSDVVYECNLWGFCLSEYIGILCGGWIMNDALVHFSLDLALKEGNFEKLCGETGNCLLAGARKFKWTTVEAKLVPAAVAILLEKELFRAGEDGHIIIDSVIETYDLNLRKYTTPAVKEALNFDVRVELRGEILLNSPGAPSTVCVIGLGSDEVQLLIDLANEDVDDDYLCIIYYAISESMIGIKAFEGKEKSKDMRVVARCEIHNVIELDNQRFFLIMSTTNEPYLSYICVGQRKKLEIFWCVVITYELKSNLFAKWLARVQLACTYVKLIFVSRIYTRAKFHLKFLVLAGFKREVFATQVIIWDIDAGFGSPAMNLLYCLAFWFSSPRPPESNEGKSSLSLLERTFAGSFLITDGYNQEVETYFILYGGAVACGLWSSIVRMGVVSTIFFWMTLYHQQATSITLLYSHCQGRQTMLTLRTRSF